MGFKKKIQHLDGREVEVLSKGITGPYDTKRIQGEGMPHHGVPSQKGDLFVKMHVYLPRQLTADQIQFVKSSGWM